MSDTKYVWVVETFCGADLIRVWCYELIKPAPKSVLVRIEGREQRIWAGKDMQLAYTEEDAFGIWNHTINHMLYRRTDEIDDLKETLSDGMHATIIPSEPSERGRKSQPARSGIAGAGGKGGQQGGERDGK